MSTAPKQPELEAFALSRFPQHKPGETVLVIHNGQSSVTILVPADFYTLPAEKMWDHYFKYALEQLKHEHQHREGK